MKYKLLFLVLILALTLTACNLKMETPEVSEAPETPTDPNEPAKGYDTKFQSIEDGMKLETTTMLDIKGEKAFPYQTFTFKDEFWSIMAEKYTDKADFTLEDGNKVSFVVNYYDEDAMVDILVNDEYLFNAWINEFFSYTFIFPNTEEFYVFDGGGHEGISVPSYYDGKFLINYRDVMTEKLGDEFKTDPLFPPFSIYVTPTYLKFIEERYCCDITYDDKDADRAKFKKFFILNRENLELLEEGKFERAS